MTDMIGQRRLRRAFLGLCTAVGALAAANAAAQPAPSFDQLFGQSAEAPRTQIIEADIARAEGLAEQARVRPNPTVSGLAENIGGKQPYSGFNRSETTIQYNQPFELGGKRSARIAAGEAGVVAARARGREALLTYAYDLARAYAAAEIADRRLALTEGSLSEARDDLRIAAALVDAGKETRLRRLQAETEVATLQAAISTARAERVQAYALLSALAGQGTSYTSLSERVLARFEATPKYGPADPLQTAPYLAAQAEREAAAYRVEVAKRQAIPDVTVSLGVRRIEADKANAMLVGVSVPLPLFDRNRGNISAALAEKQGAEARATAARLDAEAGIKSAMAFNEAADERVAAAEQTFETADEAYRLARIAYEAGKSPLIELIAARRGLSTARGTLLDALSERFDARAALARLQGRTITGEEIQ